MGELQGAIHVVAADGLFFVVMVYCVLHSAQIAFSR